MHDTSGLQKPAGRGTPRLEGSIPSLLRPKNACKAAQSGQSANQGPCFASALQIARSGRDSGNCAVRHIETIAQRSRRSQHRGVRDSLSTVRLSRIPTLSCRRATGLWPKRSPYARRQHSRRREARSGLGPVRRRSVRARPRHAVEVVSHSPALGARVWAGVWLREEAEGDSCSRTPRHSAASRWTACRER